MIKGRTASPPGEDVLDKSQSEHLPMAYLGHDLRAALAEMQAGIRLVQKLDLPESAQQLLKRFGATGDTLDRMIDQSVLVYLGQGRPGLTCIQTIRVEDLLANLSARWSGLCADSGHVFQLRPSPALPRELHIDATALDRVLTNLLTNALTHTSPCEVTLSLDFDVESESLVLEIRDQGPGLPETVLAALQDTAPSYGSERLPGTGFGFSTVCYLVSAMGGSYAFSNAATGGAVTMLSLPVPPNAKPAQAPVAPSDSLPNLAGVSVMLGEDNPTCRLLLEAHFRKLGLTLTSFEDGTDIVDMLARGARPDLLVVDDQMPGLSGLGVLNWIGENLSKAERPAVLVFTAHTTQDRTRTLKAAGAALVEPKKVLEAGRIGKLLRDLLDTRKSPEQPTVLDMSTLRKLTEIAGPLAAAELLARLDEDLEQTWHGLCQAAAKLNMDGIRQHSHVLIALAGTAGAIGLHDDAVRLNRFVHSAEPHDRIVALANSLEQPIQDLRLAVQSMAAGNQDERPT